MLHLAIGGFGGPIIFEQLIADELIKTHLLVLKLKEKAAQFLSIEQASWQTISLSISSRLLTIAPW